MKKFDNYGPRYKLHIYSWLRLKAMQGSVYDKSTKIFAIYDMVDEAILNSGLTWYQYLYAEESEEYG